MKAAADMLRHRGPDAAGFYSDTHTALGFRRLKIIDLSVAADQPMSNEDGSLQVVFNGEIYNYRELREELRKQGHTFKSASDTEVLLHLYEGHAEKPEEMLPRLRGMFAFAIWDSKRRRVFLARDPLGVKPLYIAETPGCVAFASEAKALFALGVKPEVDFVAVNEALTYRYVPAPRSGFKDVEKLPPGHFALVENGALSYQSWWNLSETASGGSADVAAEVLQRITGATQRRLIADVPLGLWLSGGIDSALVAHCANASGVKPASFSAGFIQAEYDERALARETAEHLGIGSVHESFEVPADVFRFLPQIVWHADEPYFDSSCLPTYVLAQQTKPHATVVLSGDGGDEDFAGYDRYVGLRLLERYKRVPAIMRRVALAYAQWRHPAASRQGWDRMLRWLEKCRQMENAGQHPYVAAMELFSEEQKHALYGQNLQDAIDGSDAREYLSHALLRAKDTCLRLRSGVGQSRSGAGEIDPNAAEILQRADLATYLPGDVLHKVDRMSMAHGLEVRSPFLDVDLVSFALGLPDENRLPGRETKPLLRRAAESVLPPRIAGARKRGFGVPLDDWFRGPLETLALSIFEDSRLVSDAHFKPRYWEPLWREHRAGRAQHGERLYALLSLEIWYRVFMTGSVPQQRPEPMK